MDAAITNTGTAAVFIPGPNIELDPAETKTWANVTVADLDDNSVIKDGVVAGTLSVSLTDEVGDAAQAAQGSLSPAGLAIGDFTYITTILVGFNGRIAFCTNGRKTGEGAGLGTGVPCYYDGASTTWRVFYDDTALAV